MGNALDVFRGLEPTPTAIPFAGQVQPDGVFQNLYAANIISPPGPQIETVPWSLQVNDPDNGPTVLSVSNRNWEFWNAIAPAKGFQVVNIYNSYDPPYQSNARYLSLYCSNYGANIVFTQQGSGYVQNSQFTIDCSYGNRLWLGSSNLGSQQLFWTIGGLGVSDLNPGGPGHLVPYSSSGQNTQDIGQLANPVRNLFVGTSLQFGFTTAQSALRSGTGVPAAGLGVNGDFYFRTDGAAGSSLYMKRAGAWVAATGV